LQNLTPEDDVKTLMFIAETRRYNSAKLLHYIDRMSVMDRQSTQQKNPPFAPGTCNAYNCYQWGTKNKL
jgi:hypothetical protein